MSEQLIVKGNQLLGMLVAILQGAGIASDTAIKITDEKSGKSVEITVLDVVKEWIAAVKDAS